MTEQVYIYDTAGDRGLKLHIFSAFPTAGCLLTRYYSMEHESWAQKWNSYFVFSSASISNKTSSTISLTGAK